MFLVSRWAKSYVWWIWKVRATFDLRSMARDTQVGHVAYRSMCRDNTKSMRPAQLSSPFQLRVISKSLLVTSGRWPHMTLMKVKHLNLHLGHHQCSNIASFRVNWVDLMRRGVNRFSPIALPLVINRSSKSKIRNIRCVGNDTLMISRKFHIGLWKLYPL